MSKIEMRSLSKMTRVLALRGTIAFALLVVLLLAHATASSCAENDGNTASGASQSGTVPESSPDSDTTSDPPASTSVTQTAPGEPHIEDTKKNEDVKTNAPERTLPPPLKALSEAKFLYDSSAGGSSPLTKAFVEARKQAPLHKDDLEWIAGNGTPAGRVYAAILITFDKPKAQAILTELKADKDTMVDLNSLEGTFHYSLGEIATDLLSSSSIIRLESDR
jgi:hypothetical protein